ncbi:uncharacterized protein LOC102715899 [Oryza brachyantha]|uniref:uncharacterized protein LOC102715899 n=1 Tax=Oryza brachyantha TaxID=4533 RepID=UPI0003EA9EBC|nr:uncharacterized protein LOC102715899 [Oryza brachyantha]
MGIRKEGEQQQQQQQRATVPAFGEWDDMKAAGVLPDYSLDFSKIRAVRMQQRKEGPLTWSSNAAGDGCGGGAAGEVETAGRRSSSAADGDRDRRRRHHRRRNSDGADLRRPLRADRAAPKERSNLLKGLFCCIAG